MMHLHPYPVEFGEEIVKWENEEGIYAKDDIEIGEFKVNGEEEKITIGLDEETDMVVPIKTI